MGFSASGATVVLLVGLMVSLGSLYPVIDDNSGRYADAEDAFDDRQLDRQNAAIRIDSANYTDASFLFGTEDTLVVTVRNTGTTTLSVPKTDLLVDGEYTTPSSYTVEDNPDRTTWASGENLTFTVTYPAAAAASDRVVVVTEHGVSAAREVV